MQDSVTKKEKSATEALTQKMLTINVAIVITYALIALVTGILVSSQTIMAEGISNLSAAPLAIVNLFVIKFISKRNSKKYPFGKETLEPFVGIPNNIFLLAVCVVIIVNSVQMLFAGGNHEIQVTSSILFGVFSVIFNVCVYRYFSSLAKKNPSPLVMATIIAWKFSVMVGVGIVLGFSIAWVLNLTPISGITPYIDPILAVILMLIFALSPITGMRECMRELMQTSPSDDIANAITEKIEQINNGYDFSDKVLRLGKVGNKVIVEIDYVIKGGSQLASLTEQDQLRSRFAQAFSELDYKIWLNVCFTSNIKWTEHILDKG
ncbi:MAG: cation diffusion facilitator family transporter [Defluviitaleaceae bacterium]|nr:cation diffusion facilitator family transporter [Defluviitaleaceae bacterium]MCL2240063.1 cation diffusion facilitator family transporter [Defluviitaleaceae bacterium]MCL2240278.1 cation diffusion facilitator family transporter [Defluviitaleaceae bacterium]